ncbi:carboxymuconolactone decarboxylase family protein [Leptospira stimsonii]|uniref:Carboxymuconolactone decarboxylase n=1 Tax=Leptospira stimsonii TaxID=2202203 RepID=A0A396Z6Y8_9LEPT|nr:carboxymuconolactone decarboxylase family protein [Leptospira stimsonii]RHX89337.1 carboxymuconolactone decarboxylase [Leptospira stimsonii]
MYFLKTFNVNLLVVTLLIATPYQLILSQSRVEAGGSFDTKRESIVLISAFTTKGDQVELNRAIRNGLDAGLTINEIKEILIHVYAYAGFPRSLNGLSVFLHVLKDRKQSGINDVLGRDTSLIHENKNKIELGTEIQTKLIGSPAQSEIYTFAPVIDRFLKEHLFADIFSRDILDFQQREIATLSILASLGGVESQLRSHIKVAIKIGITENELQSILSIIESKVSWENGQKAKTILENNLKPNAQSQSLPEENKTLNQNFTGKVWIDMILGDNRTWNTQIGNVTFAPGARTKWHYHPGGQILLVTKGEGYYQEKGRPIRSLKAGDVIQCLPNVPHWHGATPKSELSHFAIGTNMQSGPVIWLNPVTEKEYNGYEESH